MNFETAVTRLIFTTLLIFANYFSVSAQSGSQSASSESIYRLAPGTRLTLKLDAEIGSKFSERNDTFIATLAKPLVVRETIVLPVGTQVDGRVTESSVASVGSKHGKLILAFETIRLSNNIRRDIDGVLVRELRADTVGAMTFLTVMGGAVIGTALGATAGGKGALIGLGIGAGIGTGVTLAKKGRDVRIRKGEVFEIELKREVVLPVVDY